ncbi:hypothetical protein [Portibacter marinus]|uniref:hypothetical protein n=1 Tax=Portibacter marinus TaxID=2898660 RepID=UPI001F328245|nr:hypothetical protein [Portibacter marinus]
MKISSLFISLPLLVILLQCQERKPPYTSHSIQTERSEKMTVDSNVQPEISETPNVPEQDEVNTYMDPFDPDFITGKWEAEDYDEISFSTWFYVEDGYVSGQYCAINTDATRIDCGTQDEVDVCYVKSPYLVGADKIELEIVSCYSHKKGKATIEPSPYEEGAIIWTITEPPGEYRVDYFAHQSAVLRKVHFDPFE